MGYSVSLAHLSDLHFGERSRFACGETELADLGKSCARSIAGAMRDRFAIDQPDLVVVTGDLTQQAGEREFAQAYRFLVALQETLGVERSRFLFLPGNHDVSWERCRQYFRKHSKRRSLEYDPELEPKKLQHFHDFQRRFYGDDAPRCEELGRGAYLYADDSRLLCVAALCSCEQETDRRHYGVVSKEQARTALDVLGREEYRGYVKIVALHHAVNAIPDTAEWMDFLRKEHEAGRMTQDLLDRYESDALPVRGNDLIQSIMRERAVHLVLHGHQHALGRPHPHPWREGDGNCQVLAAGSFGLQPKKLPSDQPNCLGLLRLYVQDNRLQLKAVTLEYDPLCQPEGLLEPGGFRDTNREVARASYPMSGSQRSWVPPADETTTGQGDADLLERVQVQIADILDSEPELTTALASSLQTTADTVAQVMVDSGFMGVWSKLSRALHRLRAHFEPLRRVLLLLAQASVKGDKVAEIREHLQSGREVNVFNLQARYALMAELILKAAIETEIQLAIAADGRPASGRVIELQETGFDGEKAHDHAVTEVLERFKGLASVPEQERLDRLRDRLRAYFVDNNPFVLVHRYGIAHKLPYLVEFLLPPSHEPVPLDGVTDLGEDTLYELIKIILERTSER